MTAAVTNSPWIVATGRRKTAIARVFLKTGTGTVTVNDKAIQEYCPVDQILAEALAPLTVTQLQGSMDAMITVKGGGFHGQAGAIALGLARALQSYDPSLRAVLKKAGLMRRDPRAKERKKSGQPGARKRFQFSKR